MQVNLCRAAGNRTQSTSSRRMRTTGILRPGLPRVNRGVWAREDLNLQLLRDTVLNRTRIPIPPHAHGSHLNP
ncbi:MAG: hypothetical protein UU10_C0013G0007 [Parcubacteria group bacterium GW2011_GWF1_40_6]|uniref:Uncharacterized protein n=1 Tax=Candidatus Nomurabacteria bacterium GW2011_GWF2_40_12 TaxID=1618776 RepID=A0A0G0T5R6_9BACT|nr:MAG: hypothetical protein UT78_C0015G0003 [Candidatus Nomurabacteria bacterium GW2011_GWF2_40_12]KKR69520.1 MAG: hypothetical protein UU10_C0013G0007 [Parcubacteria group bacterium GW2011_GWF1_40_6]